MQRLNFYSSLLMVCVLLGLSALAFFTDVLREYVHGSSKYLLGAVLLLYALIRMSRVSRVYLNKKNENG